MMNTNGSRLPVVRHQLFSSVSRPGWRCARNWNSSSTTTVRSPEANCSMAASAASHELTGCAASSTLEPAAASSADSARNWLSSVVSVASKKNARFPSTYRFSSSVLPTRRRPHSTK